MLVAHVVGPRWSLNWIEFDNAFLELNSLFWILQLVIREFWIEQTEARDFVIIKYGTKLRLKTKGRSIRASCSELGKG